MEKIWAELRRIESQATQIKSAAEEKAKEMIVLATKEAEKLVTDGKAYAEEEARKGFSAAVQEAERQGKEQLKANEVSAEKLKAQAEKNMDQASNLVANTVLGETVY